MRVLQLIKSLGRGGAETLLAESHAPFAELGVACEYAFFLEWKRAVVPELEDRGARVTNLGARGNLAVMWKLPRVARLVRDADVDLIHCHLPLAGVAGRLAARWHGVPVVYTEHNLQERYSPVTRRLSSLTWSLQSRVVAVSEGVARSIAENLGNAVPVSVVRNGVDTDRFAPGCVRGEDARSRLGIPDHAPVVGTVAVFRRQKRLDLWLDAASRILERLEHAHFLIVGDGPLRTDVEGWVRDRRLAGRVHLPGLQAEIRPYLAAMDAYMIASDFEGLPVALLEAMAMGVPPVSTAVGGIPEVVDGRVGRVVTPGEPALLAEAAVEVVTDTDRGLLAEACRRRVLEGFSVRRMVKDLASIYRSVLDDGP